MDVPEYYVFLVLLTPLLKHVVFGIKYNEWVF